MREHVYRVTVRLPARKDARHIYEQTAFQAFCLLLFPQEAGPTCAKAASGHGGIRARCSSSLRSPQRKGHVALPGTRLRAGICVTMPLCAWQSWASGQQMQAGETGGTRARQVPSEPGCKITRAGIRHQCPNACGHLFAHRLALDARPAHKSLQSPASRCRLQQQKACQKRYHHRPCHIWPNTFQRRASLRMFEEQAVLSDLPARYGSLRARA